MDAMENDLVQSFIIIPRVVVVVNSISGQVPICFNPFSHDAFCTAQPRVENIQLPKVPSPPRVPSGIYCFISILFV